MKPMQDRHFALLRRHMVELVEMRAELLGEETGRPVLAPPVLEALRRVPRHRFVPEQLAPHAYQDSPLPIGFDKTISQPFICALMTDLLELQAGQAVLEIGTGCGYQTALLAELGARVWSVEIVEELGTAAEQRLHALGYTGIAIRIGDGARGWAEHAPFERIIVTAGSAEVPPALLEQLAPGGRLVMPLGPEDDQRLVVIEKDAAGGLRRSMGLGVRFSLLETL